MNVNFREFLKTKKVKFFRIIRRTIQKLSTKKENKKKEEITLWEHQPFKCIVILGLLAIIAFSAIISSSLFFSTKPEYEACLSVLCVKNIFNYFDPVINIATGFLALAGIIALMFRISQTAKQIEREQGKTALIHYFEHKKMFHEILANLEQSHSIIFLKRNSLHDKWFSRSSIKNCDFDLNPDLPAGFISEEDCGILWVVHYLNTINSKMQLHMENAILSEKCIRQQYDDLKQVAFYLNIRDKSNPEVSILTCNTFHEVLTKSVEICNAMVKLSSNIITAPEINEPMSLLYHEILISIKNKRGFRGERYSFDEKYIYICTFGHKSFSGDYFLSHSNHNINIHICPNIDKYINLTKELRGESEENGSLSP